MERGKPRVSIGQRWSNARPTKGILFWSSVAVGVVTMIVGLMWGGWVTGGTTRSMAEAAADGAVVKHLAPICAVQFKQVEGRDQKLNALKDMSRTTEVIS